MPTNLSLKRTVLKNASANLARLAASGIVALLLPPFLVRMLPTATFSTWALVLQVTAYLGFLDFGIQTAVARFVAHADELNEPEQRDGIVSSAFVLLALASAIGLLAVGVLAWQFPHIFRAMPVSLHRDAKIALLLVGVSSAVGLPISVMNAIFIGQQRNKIPVAILIASKVTMAALLAVVVFKHHGLIAMGAAVALTNVFSYAGSYLAWRVWSPHVSISVALASKAYAKQIAGYSASLGVWYLGMVMVSGLDLLIVGMFDYVAVAFYAVAVTLTNFVVQLQSAIFAAVLPASAVLHARGDSQRLGTMLVSSTRYGMLVLLGMALPFIVAGRFILGVWVGNNYAVRSVSIMHVLVVANAVRLSFLPYATLLLGVGEQRKVVLSPLAEGVTNLLASILGAHLWGAIGVAIGTLIGAFVSVAFHILYNIPRTTAIAVDRSLLVKVGLLRPLLCAAPFGLLLAVPFVQGHVQTQVLPLFLSVALIGTIYLLWNFGLVHSERRKLINVLHI